MRTCWTSDGRAKIFPDFLSNCLLPRTIQVKSLGGTNMPQSTLSEVLRVIHRMYAVEASSDLADRELVERYAANRDEAAFAALVKRHGPMILAVARRLLGNSHEVEDVF